AVPSVLEEGKVLHYCIVNDLPSLVWVANLGAIELHPNLALARDVNTPTTLAFDLDPGPPARLLDACRVGLELRSLLDQLGIASRPKTSGGKGLHVYVPLNAPHSYAQTKTFARAVAGLLARRAPEKVVDRMARRLRAGKVFVDWSQNDPTKTTVAAYSLRARERPTASTPVTWEEIADALETSDAKRLSFEANDVAKRVEELGDPFRPVLDVEQRLPSPEQV
ncbi:MAG: ATP-dependent DNA ligase, partial [Actinomycetota bacterium]|nr:ATP-dependent DNA ligase [Actinomycetota bacterium]